MAAEEREGIVDFSPLLDLNTPFDIIWDMPAESFHLILEGLTKQMLIRMFASRNTKYSRHLLVTLSGAYKTLKVFSETARWGRSIVLSQLKGSELGVFTFSLLPAFAVDMIDSDERFW